MVRYSLSFVFGSLIFTLFACGRGAGGLHNPGDESFVSPSPLGAGTSRNLSGGPAASADTRDAAASPPAARAIEEADIYKLQGNTLFVLNQYRGLQIIDVTEAGSPHLLSSVQVVGRPQDLYVHSDGLAIVVVSDYFYYRVFVDGAAVSPWHGSKVLAIDVRQPSSPVVLSTLEIEGDVNESRIVGNILYVFSQRSAWYQNPASQDTRDMDVIASFDLSNPRSLVPVAKLEFPSSGWETHANITEDRAILSQSAWGSTGPTTQFQVIDISDPHGGLQPAAHFSGAGRIKDRWSMDFSSGIFRAVFQMNWNGGARLQNWSMATPASVQELGGLSIQLPEVLTAAGFDTQYAYVVTAQVRDPLWIVDTQDPSQPRLAGQLSMPGQLDFVVPDGNRLVALGHTNENGQPFQLHVSLIGVDNPTTPTLLSRVTFGSSFGWVNVRPDDFRKAFQVLDAMGLILVPFQGWDYQSFTYEGGSQLIDLQPSSLRLRGFLAHAGSISRVFPVGTHLAAFSNESLQMIDASDRDHPVEIANLELARNVSSLVIFDNKAVELAGDWYRGAMELAVTEATDPNSPSPLARVQVPAPYATMFRDGNMIWILSTDWRGSRKTSLQGVDFSDPIHPQLRGQLDLDANLGFFASYRIWGWGNEAVLVNHALVLHPQVFRYPVGNVPGTCPATGCSEQPADTLVIISLTNPDQPHVSSSLVLSDSNWSWGLRASGNYAWLTHFEYLDNSKGRYFVDRVTVDPEHPRLLPKINVPGVYFAADPDGRIFYTQEWVWHEDGSNPQTWLHKLFLKNDHTAQLIESIGLDGAPGGADVSGRYAYLQLTLWSAPSVSASASWSATTNISTVDLVTMRRTSTVGTQNQWAWLMKSAGGQLFLQASWYNEGVLLYDLSDPAHPQFSRFVRTNGWVEDVIVENGTAYLPTGAYGVERIDLNP